MLPCGTTSHGATLIVTPVASSSEESKCIFACHAVSENISKIVLGGNAKKFSIAIAYPDGSIAVTVSLVTRSSSKVASQSHI